MFITTVVYGVIAIVAPFTTLKLPLVRDVLFYATSVVLLYMYAKQGSVTIFEAASFPMLYVVYVLTVVLLPALGRRLCSFCPELSENKMKQNGSPRCMCT